MKKTILFLALCSTMLLTPLIAAEEYFRHGRKVPYAVVIGNMLIILGGAFILNFKTDARR